MSRRYLGLVAAFVLLGLLAGCGGESENTSSLPNGAIATATREPAPTAVPVTFGEVVWSTSLNDASGAPGEALTTLPNSAPRVYAAVFTELLPAGVEVQAHWTIDGADLPDLDPDPLKLEDDRSDAWLSWSLTWTAEEPWPIGALGIVIEVNGEVKASSDILIVRDHSAIVVSDAR